MFYAAFLHSLLLQESIAEVIDCFYAHSSSEKEEEKQARRRAVVDELWMLKYFES